MKNSPLESRSRLRPCLSCGQEFRRNLQYCPNCGAERGRSELIARNLSFRELIPDGLEVYATHLEEYGSIDFGGWNYSLHKNCNPDLVSLMQPYLQEIYCASKAIYVGYSLWDKGIKKFDDWYKQLCQQLSPEELLRANVTSRWIYDFVKRCSKEEEANANEAEPNKKSQVKAYKMINKKRGFIRLGIVLSAFWLIFAPLYVLIIYLGYARTGRKFFFPDNSIDEWLGIGYAEYTLLSGISLLIWMFLPIILGWIIGFLIKWIWTGFTDEQ